MWPWLWLIICFFMVYKYAMSDSQLIRVIKWFKDNLLKLALSLFIHANLIILLCFV